MRQNPGYFPTEHMKERKRGQGPESKDYVLNAMVILLSLLSLLYITHEEAANASILVPFFYGMGLCT